MPTYRAITQNPTTQIGAQPAGNLAASLLDAMYQTLWNVINDSSNGFFNWGTDTGGANAYIVNNLSPAAAYRQGMFQGFATNNINTGASTINVDGLGSIPITTGTALPLRGGEITNTKLNLIMHDGTRFRIIPYAQAGWMVATTSVTCGGAQVMAQNWAFPSFGGAAVGSGGNGIFVVPGPTVIILTSTSSGSASYDTYIVGYPSGQISATTFGGGNVVAGQPLGTVVGWAGPLNGTAFQVLCGTGGPTITLSLSMAAISVAL